MLMRMQVRPLLPSRGIPWLLQLGMAPCRGHWCLCCAWCSSAVHGVAVGGQKGCTNRTQNRSSPFRRSKSSKNTVRIEGRCRPVLIVQRTVYHASTSLSNMNATNSDFLSFFLHQRLPDKATAAAAVRAKYADMDSRQG